MWQEKETLQSHTLYHFLTLAKTVNYNWCFSFGTHYKKAPGWAPPYGASLFHRKWPHLSHLCVFITQLMLNLLGVHTCSIPKHASPLLGNQSWTKLCWTENPPSDGVTLHRPPLSHRAETSLWVKRTLRVKWLFWYLLTGRRRTGPQVCPDKQRRA